MLDVPVFPKVVAEIVAERERPGACLAAVARQCD